MGLHFTNTLSTSDHLSWHQLLVSFYWNWNFVGFPFPSSKISSFFLHETACPISFFTMCFYPWAASIRQKSERIWCLFEIRPLKCDLFYFLSYLICNLFWYITWGFHLPTAIPCCLSQELLFWFFFFFVSSIKIDIDTMWAC